MRIGTWCGACLRGKLNNLGLPEDMHWIPFTTNPVAQFTCPDGHSAVIVVRDGAHSLLFHRAIVRLVEGQTRDAIIDAHTALEMYLSHVPARARYDRETGASPQALREALRRETKSSERVRASALAIVSLVTASSPPPFPEDVSTLRNNAVHQGLYPTEAATEAAIIKVDTFVREIETSLRKVSRVNDASYWRASHDEIVAESLAALPAQHATKPVSTTNTYLLTALSTAGNADPAEEIIADCRDRKDSGDLVAEVK